MLFALALLARVELLEGLELLYEGLVLVLEDRHPVLQTLDVLLLLPPALPRSLAVLQQPDLALPGHQVMLGRYIFYSPPTNIFSERIKR